MTSNVLFKTAYPIYVLATGEPASCLCVGVAIALREAIVEARSESGIPRNKWFEIGRLNAIF